MKKKKVSIIIISKKESEGLENGIKNWEKQDYDKKEIIVVCPEISKEFKKKFKKVKFYEDPGKGPSAARNIGYEKATGEIINFCDGDEKTKKRKRLKELEKAMKLFNEKDIDYLFIQFKPLITENFLNNLINIKDYGLKLEAPNYFPSYFNKKILERKKPFNEKLEYGEDKEFWKHIKKQSNNYGILKYTIYGDSKIENSKDFNKRYSWYGRTLLKYIRKTKNHKPLLTLIIPIIYLFSIILSFAKPYIIIIPIIYNLFTYYKYRKHFTYYVKKNALLEFITLPFINILIGVILLINFIKSFFK